MKPFLPTCLADRLRIFAKPTTIQKRFILFACVGSIGTAGHYTTLIILVTFIKQNPVTATTAGFTVGTIINYLLNYRFTFNSFKRHRVAFVQFVTIATVGMAMNAGLMWLFNGKWAMHYLVAQVLATLLVLIWNFLGNQFLTFRDSIHALRGK